MDLKLKKEKEKALLDTILTQRKQSAKIISNIVYNILNNNINGKKIVIIKRIIITRKNNAIKIQSFYRGYLIRKKIQHYISKTRTCYLIETGFSQNFKNLQMIVSINQKNKVFDLIFDKFFNKYIFFLDRTLVDKDTYNVQFIHDGKIIIDSNYEAYEEKGVYYNKIDFKKIRKKEEKIQRKNKIQIKSACSFLEEKNLSVIPKNILINANNNKENDDYKIYSEEFFGNNKLEQSMKFQTPHKKLRHSVRLENLASSVIFHRKKSCALKGILKISSSHNRRLNKQNSMKVQFGSIEFSK